MPIYNHSGIYSIMTRKYLRKPEWIKSNIPKGKIASTIGKTLSEINLFTVCQEANCPNRGKCWESGTATIMILGNLCTRGCRFCNVKTGNPKGIIDPLEVEKVLKMISVMKLKYIVITSVDRDDLLDFGAGHFAKVIDAICKEYPEIKVEVLIPDFSFNIDSMNLLAQANPFVIAHNIETVRRLTSSVRDKRSTYNNSLEVLKFYNKNYQHIATKSSIMLGLGETNDEIIQTLFDLKDSGVKIITLGQYLRPSKRNLEVLKYYSPEEFLNFKDIALNIGFEFVVSAPLARSSFKAHDYLKI